MPFRNDAASQTGRRTDLCLIQDSTCRSIVNSDPQGKRLPGCQFGSQAFLAHAHAIHKDARKHKHTYWFHSLNNKNVEQSEFQLCFCTKLFTVFPLDVKLTISKQFIKCWRIFEHAVVFNRHRQSPCFVFTHNSMSYFNNEKDGALINPPNTGCQYISIAP